MLENLEGVRGIKKARGKGDSAKCLGAVPIQERTAGSNWSCQEGGTLVLDTAEWRRDMVTRKAGGGCETGTKEKKKKRKVRVNRKKLRCLPMGAERAKKKGSKTTMGAGGHVGGGSKKRRIREGGWYPMFEKLLGGRGITSTNKQVKVTGGTASVQGNLPWANPFIIKNFYAQSVGCPFSKLGNCASGTVPGKDSVVAKYRELNQ